MNAFTEALLLFLGLVALYRPVAAVSSYLPLLQPLGTAARLRLAIGLFVTVAGIAVVTILIGEPLLELLGLSAAALSATGGIALMIAAVPLMLGRSDAPEEPPPPADDHHGAHEADTTTRPVVATSPDAWKSIVFMPLTFPLTIGGATIGILVGFRADVDGLGAVSWLIAAAVGYAAITGLCVYFAGHVERRIPGQTRDAVDRVAAILLVAIAATLLASGFTHLVIDVLHHVDVL